MILRLPLPLPLLLLAAALAWTPASFAADASDLSVTKSEKKSVKKAAVKPAKKAAKAVRKPVRKHAKAAPRLSAPINPYLPTAMAVAAAAPVVLASPPAQAVPPQAPPASAPTAFTYNPPFANTHQNSAPNPYLVNAAKPAPVVAPAPAPAPVPVVVSPPQVQVVPAPVQAAAPAAGGFSLRSLLPDMPPSDQSILPTIKKVLPTGEKPLYVLTFKCPTELIGITPIPTKALHGLVDGTFNVVNATNLLPFNMQQVCQ